MSLIILMECYKVHSMGSLLKYSCQVGCVCCAVSSLLSVRRLWQDAVQTVNVGSGDKLGCRQPWRSKWVRKQGGFVTSWNVLCWWPPSSFWVGTQGTSRLRWLDHHGRVDFEMVLKLWKKVNPYMWPWLLCCGLWVLCADSTSMRK